MAQNRTKLIDLFIGNISNAVVHEILGKAIDNDDVRGYYSRELKVSFDKARSYRGKINPPNTALPDKDINYIKDKIIRKVKVELQLRISKGYDNINLSLVENMVKGVLKSMKVI